MPFRAPAEEIVDAEVVGSPTVSKMPPRPGVTQLIQDQSVGGAISLDPNALAMYEQRARAISLFVKVPVLTLIALHPKVPAMLRLGAGLIAAWEAWQIASQEKDIEAMLPDGFR